MKKIFIALCAVSLLTTFSCGSKKTNNFLNVADFVDTTGTKDVSATVNELVVNNPHRTLYFPDGVYLLDHQILTPSDPAKTVSLHFSEYAILRASDNYQVYRSEPPKPEENWKDNYLYMLSIGGLDRNHGLDEIGSNFSITGGIIDGGNNHAGGVEIAGGQQVHLSNMTMKNVEVGLKIAIGVNSVSSDADVNNLYINCSKDSNKTVGMNIEGYDNSFFNIRIQRAIKGVIARGGGNSFRNIHTVANCEWGCHGVEYNDSVGVENYYRNTFDYCFFEQHHVAFKLVKYRAVFTNCCAFWYDGIDHPQIAIENCLDGEPGNHHFRSIFTNFSAHFTDNNWSGFKKESVVLLDHDPEDTVTEDHKSIHNIAIKFRNTLLDIDGDAYHKYLTGVDVDY